MMIIDKKTFLFGMTFLLSTTAFADTILIKDLPKQGEVTISGIVSDINNEREFTLKDANGDKIDVDITSNQPIILKKGAKITVTGTIDKPLLGKKDINATLINTEQEAQQSLGDTIAAHTATSLEGAEIYQIKDLPEEGLVKVSGTVINVANEKEFTLTDQTGTIDIDLEGGVAAAVKKGTKVTVIGYIDKGVISKDINATRVIILEGGE